MNNETQKVTRPPVTVIEVIVSLIIIYIVAMRLTVLASLVALVLLYIFFPLHRSRRTLTVTAIVLVLTVLIPVDVYVRGWHGPVHGSKHSGPRLVRVVWGMPMIQRCLDKYGEFISGGCVVRFHDTKWMLVWD
ncbi:MAG TPA: hypothetical protein VFZ59_00765 [Verrucomicrobiae bacterium]|nr:hypothetical protein [Verrucomicrobiae bacterium]